MSTLLDVSPEPDPEDIRVRLRAHMGIHKISRSKLAIASGISRASLAAKLDGPVEFTVPEITAVARALGKSWVWVMTGLDDKGPHGGHPSDPPNGPAAPPDGLEPSTVRLTVGSSAN